jgi:hypothetical protein
MNMELWDSEGWRKHWRDDMYSGHWYKAWRYDIALTTGSMFGYSRQEINDAISYLKPIYEPGWVKANLNHPIVSSLFSPKAMFNFLQVVDLGYAIANFPKILDSTGARRAIGGLQSRGGFYQTEYCIRVLSRIPHIASDIILEDDIPIDHNNAWPDASIKYEGSTYDIEIFRKDWSSYAKNEMASLSPDKPEVNGDEITSKELRRLEEEVYERLDKVSSDIPMIFICAPHRI